MSIQERNERIILDMRRLAGWLKLYLQALLIIGGTALFLVCMTLTASAQTISSQSPTFGFAAFLGNFGLLAVLVVAYVLQLVPGFIAVYALEAGAQHLENQVILIRLSNRIGLAPERAARARRSGYAPPGDESDSLFDY